MLNIHFFQTFYLVFLFLAVFLVATVGFGFWYRFESQKLKRLQQYGLRSQAQVINQHKKTYQNRNGRRVAYFVTCRFYYEGNYLDYERQVGPGTFERVCPGALVPVLFLPGQPTTMQIEGDTTSKNRILGGFIVCLIFCLLFAFAGFMAFVNYY